LPPARKAQQPRAFWRERLVLDQEVSVSPLSDDPELRERQTANLVTAPPAEPGNRKRNEHSAWATAATLPVDDYTSGIRATLRAQVPLRDADGDVPPADEAVIELLALCMARIHSIAVWIAEHGPMDSRGRLRPVVETERRLRNEARDHMRELGLTPRSRTLIGVVLQRGAATFAELLSDLDEEGE
jgi:hypothetical protein